MILVEAPFTTAAPDDDNMVDITTIICMPPSTLSVPNSPVDFIMQEGGQEKIVEGGKERGSTIIILFSCHC